MVDTAGAVGRTEPLRDDALAAERAGVLEDYSAVAGVVLVEGDTFMRMAQKLRQRVFALLDRCTPQVRAVQFEQVEGATRVASPSSS